MTVIQIERLVNNTWIRELNFYYPDLLLCKLNEILRPNPNRQNAKLIEFIPIEKAIIKYNIKQLIK